MIAGLPIWIARPNDVAVLFFYRDAATNDALEALLQKDANAEQPG